MTSLSNFAKALFPIFALTFLPSCSDHSGHTKTEDMYVVGDMSFSSPWVRVAAPPAKTSAIYFSLELQQGSDELLSANFPIAEFTEIHESKKVDGIAQMRKIETLAISDTTPVTFEPGGLHIMLINLTEEIEAGKSYPLTLTFKEAGTVTVNVIAEDKKASNHHHAH